MFADACPVFCPQYDQNTGSVTWSCPQCPAPRPCCGSWRTCVNTWRATASSARSRSAPSAATRASTVELSQVGGVSFSTWTSCFCSEFLSSLIRQTEPSSVPEKHTSNEGSSTDPAPGTRPLHNTPDYRASKRERPFYPGHTPPPLRRVSSNPTELGPISTHRRVEGRGMVDPVLSPFRPELFCRPGSVEAAFSVFQTFLNV